MKLSTMTRRDLLRAAGAATLVAACAPAAQTGASAKPAGPTGTLTFLWGGDTDKLDPPAMTTQEGFIATTAIYEGLVRYKANSTDVEPALAERWDVSSDGHISVGSFDGYEGQRAKLHKVIFQPVPEASVRALKIQRGEADIAWPFDPKDAPSLKGKADTDVLEQAGLNVNMAEFNLKKPQFQNKSLRQALNYAINKQELAEKLYSGAGVAAVGALPPTSWGFDSSQKRCTEHPDQARPLTND